MPVRNEHLPVNGLRLTSFNVRPDGKGGYQEIPIYEPVNQVVLDTAYEDAYEQPDDISTYQNEAVTEEMIDETSPKAKISRERAANPRSTTGGKTLAKVAFALVGATSLIYATDVGVTYVKDSKVISPVDAYEDAMQLPGLVKPAVDTVQGLINFVGNK
ncbi:MAG TPA: hypothetical protein VF281_01330 [Candidatus Saccharimonadales bacterium]